MHIKITSFSATYLKLVYDLQNKEVLLGANIGRGLHYEANVNSLELCSK